MVDLIADVKEHVIHQNNLLKGSMMLVDFPEATRRRNLLTLDGSQLRMSPGGSTGNTAAIVSSLGGKSSFIGAVGHDIYGSFYVEEMKNLGVSFAGVTLGDHQTAHCLAMITPDKERTMSTFLGACQLLKSEHLNFKTFHEGDILFIEGYLLDAPNTRDMVFDIFAYAENNNLEIALTLSDKNCVIRNIQDFVELSKRAALHIVIGNEDEMKAFAQENSINSAIQSLQKQAYKSVITLGADGAVSVTPKGLHISAATPVKKVIDTVGAGDAFAGGYLYAYVKNQAEEVCLTLGNKCAAVVVESAGARPHTPLHTLTGSDTTIAYDHAFT